MKVGEDSLLRDNLCISSTLMCIPAYPNYPSRTSRNTTCQREREGGGKDQRLRLSHIILHNAMCSRSQSSLMRILIVQDVFQIRFHARTLALHPHVNYVTQPGASPPFNSDLSRSYELIDKCKSKNKLKLKMHQ